MFPWVVAGGQERRMRRLQATSSLYPLFNSVASISVASGWTVVQGGGQVSLGTREHTQYTLQSWHTPLYY